MVTTREARQQTTKSSITDQDQNMAGSMWLPASKVCRKLEGSWSYIVPDNTMFLPASAGKSRLGDAASLLLLVF